MDYMHVKMREKEVVLGKQTQPDIELIESHVLTRSLRELQAAILKEPNSTVSFHIEKSTGKVDTWHTQDTMHHLRLEKLGLKPDQVISGFAGEEKGKIEHLEIYSPFFPQEDVPPTKTIRSELIHFTK